MMSNQESKKRYVATFIKFLQDEIHANASNESLTESLDVAKQCLESSFKISQEEVNTAPSFMNQAQNPPKELSQSDKEAAENLKNLGNQCMKEEKYQDAINYYTSALNIYPDNAVYLCNRAAAYAKMERHVDTIADCEKALIIDPKYSKAYSRIGLAYSGLGKHAEAIAAYKKCLEIDPDNVSARQNLSISESRVSQTSPGVGLPGGLPSGINMSAVQQVASQLMKDPNMQNMFSNFMSSAMGPGSGSAPPTAPPTAGVNPPGDAEPATGAAGMNMENLFSLGQQLLGNLQRENPDLVNNLMSNLGRSAADGNPPSQ